MYEELRLNDEQFNTLKQLLVQRLVDKMTSKDLVRYITDDMSEEVYHTIFGGNFLFSNLKLRNNLFYILTYLLSFLNAQTSKLGLIA